jgi:hypothetical protein
MSRVPFPRLLAPPQGSFFLFGPRGAGKSTWLRHVFPQAHRVDLLDEALYQSYLTEPGGFAGELRAQVRSGTKVFEADLRGLRAVADLRPVRRLLVFRGERR